MPEKSDIVGEYTRVEPKRSFSKFVIPRFDYTNKCRLAWRMAQQIIKQFSIPLAGDNWNNEKIHNKHFKFLPHCTGCDTFRSSDIFNHRLEVTPS